MTSLSDYYDMLQKHDWTHAMSDDQSVYRRGRDVHDQLLRISKESPKHAELYDKYYKYGWGEGPQPQKPMEKTFRTGEQDAQS